MGNKFFEILLLWDFHAILLFEWQIGSVPIWNSFSIRTLKVLLHSLSSWEIWSHFEIWAFVWDLSLWKLLAFCSEISQYRCFSLCWAFGRLFQSGRTHPSEQINISEIFHRWFPPIFFVLLDFLDCLLSNFSHLFYFLGDVLESLNMIFCLISAMSLISKSSFFVFFSVSWFPGCEFFF